MLAGSSAAALLCHMPSWAQTAAPRDTDWTHYANDISSTRYSPLDQINASNFNKLELAWRFSTNSLGPRLDADFMSTPLVAKGRLYCTAGFRRDMVCLDAGTGELLWMHTHDEGQRIGSRGGAGLGAGYWTDGNNERIIYVTRGYNMFSLDAKTGRPDPDFGTAGMVDLRQNDDQEMDPNRGVIGLHAPPLVVKDTIVVGAPFYDDGAAGLKALATSIHQQFPDARYNVKRAISQGDLVLLHSNVVLVPGTKGAAVIDIFRFQGGKLAEHWDVIQNVPDTTASGNDMFSTLSSPQVSQPLDHRLTQANEALVTKAFDELMVHKDLTALDRYWDPGYLQHNTQMQSGVPAAKVGLGNYFASAPQLTVTPKRIIAEGDLVAVHSHYVNYPGDRGSAILDLFRVRNGKIVEHWDIIQNVPETSANNNGMF